MLAAHRGHACRRSRSRLVVGVTLCRPARRLTATDGRTIAMFAFSEFHEEDHLLYESHDTECRAAHVFVCPETRHMGHDCTYSNMCSTLLKCLCPRRSTWSSVAARLRRSRGRRRGAGRRLPMAANGAVDGVVTSTYTVAEGVPGFCWLRATGSGSCALECGR